MKLPEVDLGRFAIKSASVRVERSSLDPECVEISARIETNSLDGDGSSDVVTREMIPLHVITQMRNGPQLLRDTIRTKIREAVLHELDEWLRVDGKLMVNPHPEVPRDDVWKR